MDPDSSVGRLAADSGELLDVKGSVAVKTRFDVIEFEFVNGTLRLTSDVDTDEIILDVLQRRSRRRALNYDPLTELIGMEVSYAWTMTNHRGYLDAFQLRLFRRDQREETRQFEVAGSAIDVYRVLD